MRLFVIGGGGCINYIIKMMMGVYESCIEAEKESFVKYKTNFKFNVSV